MFTSPNPFTVIVDRAARLLERIEQKIARGEITTRSGLLVTVLDSLSRYTNSLRQPSLTPTPMRQDDLLLRDLVETPLAQAAEDVELAGRQTEALRQLSLQTVNLCLAELAGLAHDLTELTATTDAFRLWVSDSDPNFIWVGDQFNDKSRVGEGSSVFVDNRGGTCSLIPTASRSLNEHIASASLDKELSLGGVPGNNLEIRSPGREAFTGNRPEPRPRLFAERQPKSDNLANIWDGDPQSWYEWERYKIHQPQRVIKAGHSWVADPSGKPFQKIMALGGWNVYVRWPGESRIDTGERRRGYSVAHFPSHSNQARKQTDKERPGTPEHDDKFHKPDLFLGINLAFDAPRSVNWMQLTPLIKGNAYPEVVQVLVSRDGERWVPLLKMRKVLHPQMNQGLDFAPDGIPVKNHQGVGVFPLPAGEIQYVKLVLRQQHYYECELGAGHLYLMKGKKRKRIKAPVRTVGSFQSTLADPGDGEDFADTETQTNNRIQEGYDLFQAERQVIAIRDLTFEERTYAEAGILVSTPYQLQRAVRAVALLATEELPESWTDTNPDGEPWIQYQISTDGATWHSIVPQRTELEDTVVGFAQPTTTVYFRATFTRPEEAENESPLLLAYGLKLLPA